MTREHSKVAATTLNQLKCAQTKLDLPKTASLPSGLLLCEGSSAKQNLSSSDSDSPVPDATVIYTVFTLKLRLQPKPQARASLHSWL